MTVITKIEESGLWTSASDITKAAYMKIDSYPEEEKWLSVSRLRQHASSIADDIAMAEGATDPRDVKHYLGSARKELFGLKSIYKVSHDTKLNNLEPEQMVRIDQLVEMIDNRLESVPAELEKYWQSLEAPEKKK